MIIQKVLELEDIQTLRVVLNRIDSARGHLLKTVHKTPWPDGGTQLVAIIEADTLQTAQERLAEAGLRLSALIKELLR
jgi:hypothetical protein